MCCEAWHEKINYPCIDKTKSESDGKYRIFNENKDVYF